jgi:hypothetical protein
MVDLLHLFLRISEALLVGLTFKLISKDKYKKRDDFEAGKCPNISKYFIFLNEKCKIKVMFNDSEYTENKGLLHRSLNGNEKLKIFQNIDIVNYFPDLYSDREKLIEYEFLWKEFHRILCFVKQNTYKSKANDVERWTKNWLEIFLNHHFQKEVKPYIHVFCNHLHQFVEMHGNLNIFNIEGLEKLNDISTMEFFRSTNKRDGTFNNSFLNQMIKRRERTEIIRIDQEES